MTQAPSPTAEADLERERRTLLGDARSPDRMSGPELQRFVSVSGQLRALKRSRGEVAPRPGKTPRKQVDVLDL